MSRPQAPWTELIRSLPSTMTIAEMAEHARSNGFPEVTNTAVYSSRNAAGLEYKHVLPPRKGIKYKVKAKKFQAKNGHAKLEPKTAAEAMAVIQRHKQETANQGPTRADMEAALRKVVIKYGTEHIRAFLDRLEDS